jgi:hypothetical protein
METVRAAGAIRYKCESNRTVLLVFSVGSHKWTGALEYANGHEFVHLLLMQTCKAIARIATDGPLYAYTDIECLLLPAANVWQDRRLDTFNVTLRRVRATTVAADYIFWVCVCSLRYPARNAHAPHCQLWPVRLYSIFSYCLIKARFLRVKCSFLFCLQILSATFPIPRRNEWDMMIQCIGVPLWSYCVSVCFL